MTACFVALYDTPPDPEAFERRYREAHNGNVLSRSGGGATGPPSTDQICTATPWAGNPRSQPMGGVPLFGA